MPKTSSSPNHLTIESLHVSVQDTEILQGLNLTVKKGEIHAIMGPNGSGKSTLAYSLAGHPNYEVTAGSVKLADQDILEMSPDQRAQAGLFLAFQYPVEVPGVRVEGFLRTAYKLRFADQPDRLFTKALDFRKHLEKLADNLAVDKSLLRRGLNEGFSGGEKKRLEILQMALLEPEFAILDETDSGLDIDAIKAVSTGINHIVKNHQTGLIVITHYRRILDYIQPTHVHVLKRGTITQSGGMELVDQLEATGYGEQNER